MDSITQDMRFRLSLILYAEKYGVSKAACKYKTNRQYVYRWLKRYDGSWSSLRDRSRRPHHHPNEHTPDELKLIRNMRRRNPNAGLFRVLKRLSLVPVKPPNPKYVPKPYEQMLYPGQRVQIDVKHVPAACIVGQAKGKKFYQFTAIDEFSRFRYLEAFEECSTYASTQFLDHMLDAFPFAVECVQTDNGMEFTKRFSNRAKDGDMTLFEKRLAELGICHKLIRPFTPRHNGKVERSHRKDNEYFYATHTFYSFDDFKAQLKVHSRRYNAFPMRPLGWKSPRETLFDFLIDGVTYV